MTPDIPTRLVEAAARALHELAPLGEPTWDDLEEADRDSCRKVMRVALAAVFAECEVREEWCESGEYQGQDGSRYVWPVQWRPNRPVPKTGVDNWRLTRRLVITTPPETPWEGEGQ